MTIELKPGYWKTRSGKTVQIVGRADGVEFMWLGILYHVPWGWNDSGGFSDTETECDLVEYLGPTLPPDPSPGYRLLRKWPEPEPVRRGKDEFQEEDGTWSVSGRTEQATYFWYRRRVTPEPPTPPGFVTDQYRAQLQRKYVRGDGGVEWRDVGVSR